MVKGYSDNKKGNLQPPLYGLFFSISSKGSFICTIQERIAHTTAFVNPVLVHCLEQNVSLHTHTDMYNVTECYTGMNLLIFNNQFSHRQLFC